MQLEPAIIAPWPAVETDHERTLREERGKLNELPLAVGHAEIWQSLANIGDLVAVQDIAGDAGDELVVSRLHLRQQLAQLAKIELEPLVQRGLEMVGLGERLGERLVEGFRFGQQRLRRADKGSIRIATGNAGPPNRYEWG